MRTCTCTNCHREIARADARLRSVAFRPVAFCRACWNQLYPASDEVPEPRRPVDDIVDAGGR